MGMKLLLIVLVFSAVLTNAIKPIDEDPYRTGFHFQPPKYWMNDPNGPMLYKGVYHLFYQYNPNGAEWGPPVWVHSTSTDLVNWTPQPIAIARQGPANFNGSWSGSATVLPGNKPVILFTGINKQNVQVQNLALPKDHSDQYLREWVLVKENPLITPDPNAKLYNASAFRDPSTAWVLPDGRWRIILGSNRHSRGVAVLFRSSDFKRWTMAKNPLYSVDKIANWECPELFPVYSNGSAFAAETSVVGPVVRHVLKVSLDELKLDTYYIGTYDTVRDVFVPDPVTDELNPRLDYGKYYASKSFYDHDKKRRVFLSWVSESWIPQDVVKAWAGIHAIPRTVLLDKHGKKLVSWPIKEVEKLRENQVQLPSQVLRGASILKVPGITASQADVEISFKIPQLNLAEELDPKWTDPQRLCSRKGASFGGGIGPFGLLTLSSEGLEEFTAVFFKIFKATDKFIVLMCSDQTKSSLNTLTEKSIFGTFVDVDLVHHDLTLRVLIDHSIVESFAADGLSCITARVYPTLAINNKAKLFAYNYGLASVKITSLKAWSMKKANLNQSSVLRQ